MHGLARWAMRLLLLLACLPACSLYDDPPDEPLPLTCDAATSTRAFRVDAIDVPGNATEADDLGWDLDGDGSIDNQGGNVISAIDNAIDVDLQGAVDDALNSDLVQIGMTVETCGAPDFFRVSLVRGLELDRSQEPPVLTGEEVTTWPSQARDAVPAAATDGLTQFPVGQLIHWVADDWIDAHELVAVVQEISDDEVSGYLVAGLDADQTFDVVTRAFQAKVVERQDELGPCTPESCDPVLRDILDIFDTDNNGGVDLEEVRSNTLMQTLLYPDLDLDGDGEKEAYSIGVGFHASRVDLEL